MLSVAVLNRYRRFGAEAVPPDETAPSGYAIAFDAGSYTEGVDDDAVSLDVTSAEVGASWALTISSSGGGTPVTDSGTVASASFTISALDLTGLSPGTLTASLVLTDAALNEGDPATDTATLAVPAYSFTNAEAETVVAAFSVEPDNTRKALIDDLVGALKTAGVWGDFDLFYVTAAHDEQAARVNWKNPGTFDLTNYNNTTFVADVGFTGNGSNMYLGTNCDSNQLAVASQNTTHIGAWDGANIAASDHLIGSETVGFLSLNPRTPANDIRWQVNCVATGPDINITDSVGHTIANRNSAATMQAYKNGSSVATATDASVAEQPKEIWLLRNQSNYSTRTIRAAHVGYSLTSGQATSLYNALNAYMAGL